MNQEDEKSGLTLERIRALIPLLTEKDLLILGIDVVNEMNSCSQQGLYQHLETVI